jgi:hypothetical protein
MGSKKQKFNGCAFSVRFLMDKRAKHKGDKYDV